MKSRTILPAVLLTIAGFLLTAPSAGAQESAVVGVVRDLATTTDGATAGRRLAAALAEWDRQIANAQAHVASTTDGADVEGAFGRRVELGLMYRRRGKLGEALRQFDAAAALQPQSSDVHVLRALTFEAAGKHVEAAQSYQAAWANDASSPVKAYLMLRRTPAVDAASAVRARDALNRAYRAVLSGDARPSTPFLTLDLVPDTFSRAPVAGDARLSAVFARIAEGRLDEAVALLTRAGPPVNADDSARARIERGGAAEREGRLPDARREYTAALAGTLSGRHLLHVGIARLAQVDGDTDAALAAFGRAVRLSPNDPALRREFAAALMAAHRYPDAFAELVAALVIAPEDAEALAAIAQMFLDTDRAGEAVAPLRRALAIKTDRYETHYALAVALSRSGQSEEAAREFERFDRLSRQALDQRRRVVAGQAGPDESKR
jgi:tetratricopeptide (TPR) repeat protein